jgi:methanogenic corrinoid protein MtbC1
MGEIVTSIRAFMPETKILIGGAPVNTDFCQKIGADFYAPDPQQAVEYMNKLAS